MFQALLIVLVLAAVIFMIVAALQPKNFRITRSATINAPPSVIFAEINDFYRWGAWSPWAGMDPAAKYSFSGPQSGVGSHMTWDGNSKVGAGSMTITASEPAQRLVLRLEFLRPMQAVNLTEFILVPQGAGTKLTWSMSGENKFIGKAVSLLMNCDRMVGGQFDRGLAQIKQIAESNARAAQ